MTPSPFGAAKPHVGLRPRGTTVPLPDVHPDDAYADHQDHLWSLYEAEQARDRRDDYAGRAWPSATVSALPVAGREGRRAA